MGEDGRRKKDGGTWREFNDEVAVPQDQVPAFLWIKRAKGGDGTPPEG